VINSAGARCLYPLDGGERHAGQNGCFRGARLFRLWVWLRVARLRSTPLTVGLPPVVVTPSLRAGFPLGVTTPFLTVRLPPVVVTPFLAVGG
jgi:hypothetical protein